MGFRLILKRINKIIFKLTHKSVMENLNIN